MRFVTEQCRLRNPASVVCGLRSFLRWCHLLELTPQPLTGAVPAAANWHLAALPKANWRGSDTCVLLLDSCDRRTTFGRRDFAMLTVLARLGPPRWRSGDLGGLTDFD